MPRIRPIKHISLGDSPEVGGSWMMPTKAIRLA
jgi:hypothetical protein